MLVGEVTPPRFAGVELDGTVQHYKRRFQATSDGGDAAVVTCLAMRMTARPPLRRLTLPIAERRLAWI
jgi:hypothetical protein